MPGGETSFTTPFAKLPSYRARMRLHHFGFTVIALVACGGAASDPSGDGGAATNGGSFVMSAGTAGMFACPEPPQAVLFGERLEVFCNQTLNATTSTTLGALTVAAYHGGGTYSFSGSSDPTGSQFNLTIGNTFLSAVPATSCALTAAGPATLSKGTNVTLHVHCERMSGVPIHANGTYAPPIDVTVDGDVDAFASQ